MSRSLERSEGRTPEAGARVLDDSAILEHLFEESPLPIAIYDQAGRVRRRNDAHRSFVSALGAAAGLGDSSVLVDERSAAKAHARHFARAYAGSSLEYGFSCLRGEGPLASTLHFQHLLVPVRAPDGSVASVVGIIVDVTEKKNATEERTRFRERLFQLQKLESLGLLAGGIAHDFNNLLLAVLGNASHVLRALSPDSPLQSKLVAIETAARRAAEVAHQMLLYAGKGKAELQEVDVVGLVEELSALLRVSISKQATLRLDCEPAVPLVRGDGTQLRQVVMNLITNASEALGERPGQIRVRTGHTRPEAAYLERCFGSPDPAAESFVYIEVRDDGCGMSPEVIVRAFDPFYTTKRTGRGLGLAAVLGIIRRHRGALFVESAVGAGTCMRVLLPSFTGSGAPARESAPPQVALRPGLPVLLVDDDARVRDAACALLEEVGCHVRVADSGEAALQICERHAGELALVVMDVTMPGLGGLAARERIVARNPGLPVLLMSGFAPPDAIERPLFLAKPFGAEELRAAVAAALSQGQAVEHAAAASDGRRS